MAKFVLVCYRDPTQGVAQAAPARVKQFLQSLCPDNLKPNEPVVTADGRGLWFGMFNPRDPDAVRQCSGYTGWLLDRREDWWQTGTLAPNGSYALIRSDEDQVEAVADAAASRTLWYAHTDSIFVVSSSMRAIPYFLGSFELNTPALAWMLSCGSLGPEGGWDRRAKRLGPDGVARLDRRRWQLSVREPQIDYRVDPVDDATHAQRMRNALMEAVSDMGLDLSRWVLPLSGGFDSRAILLLTKDRSQLRTVTWGRRKAREERGSDAYVAQHVAAAVGVPNRYFSIDLSPEPFECLLERYLVAGDGRTDGFAAYLDGFATWRTFAEAGVTGVIRGDHGFGPGPGTDPQTEAEVLRFNSMPRWQDHPGTPSFSALGLPQLEQQLPESYAWRPDEAAVDWRDRHYLQYRVPAYVAAQSDLKAPYVEVASPFFVRSLVELTRSLPRHLRSGKQLFRDAVAPLDVPVRYAIDTALVSQREFLDLPVVREYLGDALASSGLRNLFSPALADYLSNGQASADARPLTAFQRALQTPRRYARLWIPKRWRSPLGGKPKARPFDPRWIALRACIASRMVERLKRDGAEDQRSWNSRAQRSA